MTASAPNFSLSHEKFFLVGSTPDRRHAGITPTKNRTHLAFKVSGSLAVFEQRLRKLGVEIKPPRPRVEAGASPVRFYDFDNPL